MDRPAFFFALAWSPVTMAEEPDSPIRGDEEVVFYPTFARQTDGGRSWQAAIHGSIFEPEERSLKRAVFVTLLRKAIPGELTPAEEETFRRRVRFFLIDSERGKGISIRLGATVLPAGTSGADAHFRGEWSRSNDQMASLAGAGRQDGGWGACSAMRPSCGTAHGRLSQDRERRPGGRRTRRRHAGGCLNGNEETASKAVLRILLSTLSRAGRKPFDEHGGGVVVPSAPLGEFLGVDEELVQGRVEVRMGRRLQATTDSLLAELVIDVPASGKGVGQTIGVEQDS